MSEKKMTWQLQHEENGYEVKRLASGQQRAYGPSIYEYIVRDMTGERTEGEVRQYCITRIRRADDPKKHDLITHLKAFRKLDDGSYKYVSGHEYTG